MEGGALSDDGFADFAKDVVLFCHITSKIEGEKYPGLLKEKGGRGFPTLWFLDAKGEILSGQRDRSVQGFSTSHAALKTLAKLESEGKVNDPIVAKHLFMARLQLGKFKFEEAKAKAAELKGCSDEEQANIDACLLSLEIRAMTKRARAEKGKHLAEVAQHFLAMQKAGRTPQDKMLAYSFWNTIMSHARKEKDADMFADAIAQLKKAMGDDPKNQRMYDHYDKQLKELREGKTEDAPAKEAKKLH